MNQGKLPRRSNVAGHFWGKICRCLATISWVTIGPAIIWPAIIVAAESSENGATGISTNPSAEAPPDILLILVDDLGRTDLGCDGHRWHHTPNIDRLSDRGMRFTNAYSPAPICSAARASFLTGKSPARLGFEFVTKNNFGPQQIDATVPLQAPPLTVDLPLSEITLAESLSSMGYQTAFFGKWHVARHHRRYLGWSPTHGPPQQGFDVAVESFGSHPYQWPFERPRSTIDERFEDDAMVKAVCKHLRGHPHDDPAKPRFVMASSFFVHTPVKTRSRSLRAKYERLVPSQIANRERKIEYACFVETLDHHVGQMITALQESGRGDRTVVFFVSDNGGHPQFTSNAPFRGSKWNLYEGGIRVPWIVVHPDVVAAKTVCDVPVIGWDLLPTMIDLANPSGGISKSSINTKHIDGRSLVPLLRGNADAPVRSLVWHFPYYHPETRFAEAATEIGVDDGVISQTRPQSAIRHGNHKLLQFAETQRIELYDLDADPSEQNDLSNRRPVLAAEMKRRLNRSLRDANARHATPIRDRQKD